MTNLLPFAGPWFIPMNRKLVYDLARLESSLLTISVAKRINFVPLIIVKTYRGQISIEGLKHFNQLPLYGKTYCKIETQNDTFNGGSNLWLFQLKACNLLCDKWINNQFWKMSVERQLRTKVCSVTVRWYGL